MNMWRKTAGSVALFLLLNAAPALAEEQPRLIMAPLTAEEQVQLISAPAAVQDLTAKHALPKLITVFGKSLSFDQQPLLQGEDLLVPLRFVVEAADGKVAWDGETQTITVTMPDRTATFVVGQDQAEMNEKGVFYIQRNLIKLTQPVSIVEGRTMISADALSSVLGLVERVDADANLDLVKAELTIGDEAPISIQIVPNVIGQAEAPAELQTWAVSQRSEEAASYAVIPGAEGRYLAISGGLQPTGGYSIEIVSTKLVDGTWVIEAQVVPPSGPATQAFTNPVSYFQLSGMEGEIEVHVLGAGAQAEKR